MYGFAQESNRRLPDELRRRAMELVRARYADFGPALAAEKLAELHALTVSRETLRKWMVEGGGSTFTEPTMSTSRFARWLRRTRTWICYTGGAHAGPKRASISSKELCSPWA